MANEHLATYLNDHLAGSVVALELLDQLEATHYDGALGDFFSSYAPMLPQIATASKGLCSACISARADGLMPAQKSFLATAVPEASKVI